MVYTKENAIRIVVSCAEAFQNELDGKSLLFIMVNKHKHASCIEFSFYGYNYLHLTGLKVKRMNNNSEQDGAGSGVVAANDFYHRCLKHKLSASDFEFAEDGTTHLKLDILPSVINKNLSANMIGDYDSLQPRLYTEKLAGNVHGCIGFVVDKNSGQYVPNTVLKEDIRNCSSNARRIIAIYRKTSDAEKYKEITYLAKNVDWNLIKYPEEYKYLETFSKG